LPGRQGRSRKLAGLSIERLAVAHLSIYNFLLFPLKSCRSRPQVTQVCLLFFDHYLSYHSVASHAKKQAKERKQRHYFNLAADVLGLGKKSEPSVGSYT